MIIQGSLTLEWMKTYFLDILPPKKAYKFYNLRFHKIIESANVTVDDTKSTRIQIQESEDVEETDEEEIDEKEEEEGSLEEDAIEEEE